MASLLVAALELDPGRRPAPRASSSRRVPGPTQGTARSCSVSASPAQPWPSTDPRHRAGPLTISHTGWSWPDHSPEDPTFDSCAVAL